MSVSAVFLDRATFSADLDLPMPEGVTDYRVYDQTQNDVDLIVDRCSAADIIITNKVILDRQVIARLPRLKLIQLTATGMNNVDAAACQAAGVALYNVAGYAIQSVPEHTFMLILSAMRSALYYHDSVVSGRWRESGQFCLLDQPLLDLQGRTLGVIGAGVIGRRVSEIARVFGMQVLWSERPNQVPRSPEYTDFETVLAQSDVLSLHCPLTPETHHLINEQTLAKMAKKPLIVNLARGGVVDGQAVAQAVLADQILGYASDVFADEPLLVDDPLLALADHPRVIFSPHNAWGSLAAQRALWQVVCTQVHDFIEKNCGILH